MKKLLIVLMTILVTTNCFAKSKHSKKKSKHHHVQVAPNPPAPAIAPVPQVEESQSTANQAMQSDDLEKINLAIDPDEDIHVVSVEYENGYLKHMKVDAFVINNKVQLSTTYTLEFKGNNLEITIEDYITGLKNKILPDDSQEQSYQTESYAVKCFKKDGEYHSTYRRTCQSSFQKPLLSGLAACHAPTDDELQLVQKMQMDNAPFVYSVRNGLQSNLEGILADLKTAVPFVMAHAETSPQKLICELFTSRLRIYLYDHILSTLHCRDELDNSTPQPEAHKAQD